MKICVCLLLESVLGEVVARLRFSIVGSTLRNCSRASSGMCLPTTKPVNSSIDMRWVIWAEGAAEGNDCGRERHLGINENDTD